MIALKETREFRGFLCSFGWIRFSVISSQLYYIVELINKSSEGVRIKYAYPVNRNSSDNIDDFLCHSKLCYYKYNDIQTIVG